MNLKRTLTTIQKIMTADAPTKEPITATLEYGCLKVSRPGRSITIKGDAFRGKLGACGTVLLADLLPLAKSSPSEIEIVMGNGAERTLKTDKGIAITAQEVTQDVTAAYPRNEKPESATVPRDTFFSPMIAKILAGPVGASFGVFRLEVSDKHADVCATDSVRMIVASGPAKGKLAITLPSWTALVAGLIATSPIEITRSGHYFEIANEDRTVIVEGLEDERSFPNWRAIMPNSGDALSATFKPDALAKTVELLMPFAGDANNSKIKTITIDVPEGRTYRQMEIKAPGTKDAHAVGCFASGFLRKPITFNPKYIAEFLATIKREAVAKWQLWDSSRPALFSAKSDDAEFRYLLMPINLP